MHPKFRPPTTVDRSILIGLGTILVATGVLMSGGFKRQAHGNDIAETVLPVTITEVQPVTSYTVNRWYTGEVVARQTSELGFERAGTVVSLLVDQGDRVTAGDSLAALDLRTLQTQKQQLLAQIRQAQAQLQELEVGPRVETIAAAEASVQTLQEQLSLATTRQTRRDQLYQEGALAREQLDEAETETRALAAQLQEAQSQLDELLAGTRPEQLTAQAAQVAQLEARLASLEVDITKSTLRAPFSGRIAARRVDEGTVVSSGQSILRIVEDDTFEAHVGLPISVATSLELGSAQTLIIADQAYPATLTARLPEVDPTTRTLTAILEFPASPQVNVGQRVRLETEEQIDQSGYWLPTKALVPGVEGLWSAYTLVATDSSSSYVVEREDLELLHTDSHRVLVRGTLQPGDQVITDGTQRIVTGQRVRPAS